MIATNQSVELVVQDIANGRLERKAFFFATVGIGPEDLFWHLEPRCTLLSENLKAWLWEEAAGIAPHCAMIAAK
jgi:hypothetical protein